MINAPEQPFDLYSRNRIVGEVINKYLRKDGEKFTILDLGGYRGDIEKFLPKDKVTILDVYDIKDKSNYVKGDATKLDFKDNAFDITTSFDVLEHIPASLREDFIKESVRVAKNVAFMTFPVNTDEDNSVSAAENQLNAFFRHLTGRHHPWLVEHIRKGIPSSHDIEIILNSLSVKFIKIYSNDLDLWKSMQMINFTSSINIEFGKLASNLNKLYRENIESMEADVVNGYRVIYIVAKDNRYYKAIEPISKQNVFMMPNNKNQWDKTNFNTYVQDRTNLIMATKLRDYNSEIVKSVAKDNRIRKLEEQFSCMSNSISWTITRPLRRLKKLISPQRHSS